MDEWMDRLREQTDDVRPANEAHARITQELGRRRRRRHGLAAVGAIASVVLVAGAAAAVPMLVDDEAAPDESNTATTTAAAPDASFTCPPDNPVTERPPPGSRPLDQRVLDPVLRYAKRATRGIEGLAGFAYWDKAGAILVEWKDPVPEQVRSLEDVQFKSGGQIIVRGVTYSAVDVRRAHRELNLWLRESGLRDHWSMSVACDDFSGLEVGMTPDWLADQDVTALQADIAEAIGMPAYVVPVELVVPLG